MFAEDEATVLLASARDDAELEAMVRRRSDGEPLEVVVGWAEFHGLRVVVEPGVFVPRRRSELLVRVAVADAPRPAVVVDLCCGSGALGAAVAADLGDVELYASDVEPAAVRCARRTLEGVGTVVQGDLFAPLPARLRGRVDVLLANVPYVPTGELALLPAEARLHEPRSALDGGADGLDVLRRVAATAASWLAPGGRLLVETSAAQARAAEDVMTTGGLAARTVRSEPEEATVVVGTRAADPRDRVTAR